MTPKQFMAEVTAFAREIGSSAMVSTTITSGAKRALSASVYACWPRDYNAAFSIEADDFPEMLAALKEKWASHYADYSKQTIHKMALAVISITSITGSCSDAALREKFTAEQIVAFSASAVEHANLIAANGPFSIVTVAGANGAPDRVDESRVLQ
jgi:hypothetical protein